MKTIFREFINLENIGNGYNPLITLFLSTLSGGRRLKISKISAV